jgi:Family of unknown function (DUF5906)
MSYYANEAEAARVAKEVRGAQGKAGKRKVAERVRPNGDVRGVSVDDFHAYMPMHSYIFVPTRELWPAASVNARIPPIPVQGSDGERALDESGNPKSLRASIWLDQNRAVEQMTWAPGRPMLINDRLISNGGWIERGGSKCFNLYRPPNLEPGNASQAKLWIEHGKIVYGEDFKHICLWLAHRVQRPGEKVNHALVLGGAPGTGKDTLLEPVKRAVGPWNFNEVSPRQLLGRFNGFLKSVILRINEARDLGETDRLGFYDATKILMAAPPDVLRIDEKNIREYSIFNCVGAIITTNHKTNGLYLPPEDRRHFVAWSDLTREDLEDGYWAKLWGWYESGGYAHVAAYLASLDLTGFDPKAPPPKTKGFWAIVDANRAVEEAELEDVLDRLADPVTKARPATITLERLAAAAGDCDLSNWLKDRRNRRIIPQRLERCGYEPVRNQNAKDGLWKIDDARQAVYARRVLSPQEQFAAAWKLAGRKDVAESNNA